eukprot:COSAG01_NODE_3553_length_5934_cov_4.175282_4_plen_294_part_00
MKGVGIFGPTDPRAGGAYDGGCCCACCDAACTPHERWRGKPGGCSLIRLASFCRPLVLTPAADAVCALLAWLVLGNGQLEKRLRLISPPKSVSNLTLQRLYHARGVDSIFGNGPNFVDHSICHTSLGWIWGLRVICSDWGFDLTRISACGGPVLVATSDDDVVCAPQIARWVAQQIGPTTRLYESHQGWNHNFMICELDKLLRILLDDGVGLELPDGRMAHEVSPALNRLLRSGWDNRDNDSSGNISDEGEGMGSQHRQPTTADLHYMIAQLHNDNGGIVGDGDGNVTTLIGV